MSKTKHTEGILKIKFIYNDLKEKIGIAIICDYKTIFLDVDFKTTIEQKKANAARLVKCWNMHDELIIEMKIFCHRVEIGEVRSKKTYARFKELIKQSEQE